MVITPKNLIAVFQDITVYNNDASTLRGFFANMDKTNSILHNHYIDGGNAYQHPLVQYKIINNTPCITAYNSGISAIYPYLQDITFIRLGNKTFENPTINIQLSLSAFGDSEEMLEYEFITPWMALNQENYKKYSEPTTNRNELLSNILIGNILAAAKGLDLSIESTLVVSLSLKQVPITYKNQQMIGFMGTFKTNCHIPHLLGIGKGTSRGYGTISHIKSN